MFIMMTLILYSKFDIKSNFQLTIECPFWQQTVKITALILVCVTIPLLPWRFFRHSREVTDPADAEGYYGINKEHTYIMIDSSCCKNSPVHALASIVQILSWNVFFCVAFPGEKAPISVSVTLNLRHLRRLEKEK